MILGPRRHPPPGPFSAYPRLSNVDRMRNTPDFETPTLRATADSAMSDSLLPTASSTSSAFSKYSKCFTMENDVLI
ncbi:Uncharacterised protein [Bordetella pertussis]|nr:Uncharacterised protein [Bordetella pertussis]CPN61712.1 Uncharacterised protein [Bordetella pertussis]CPO51622.1 Uncharacterised protein [Bordetella pertussis]